MQIQFHPASGRATVRTFSVEERGQRVLIGLAAVLLLLVLSLPMTVPAMMAQRARQGQALTLTQEVRTRRADWGGAMEAVRSLRQRTLESGDLLNRIAFLYSLPAAQWPRILNPERAVLDERQPGRFVASIEQYLRGLERARELVASREAEEPGLSAQAPAVSPIAGVDFEPSSYFGPRKSPWTGEEEFFLGVDLAAPRGSAVVATGAGTVAFAGTVRPAVAGWFWRLGNMVVVSHPACGATVFGHLASIDVRRGQRVARGDRLGTIGSTGWAMSPQLHYEFWRAQGTRLLPTDPLFATLDRPLNRGPLSLEQMENTSAPGPLDPVPGIQVPAERVAGPVVRQPAKQPRGSRRRHRI